MAGAVVAGLLLAISPALSAPAEKLSPVDQAGYQKLLASNKGSVLVVDFWATWCVPCRAEMPQLAKLHQKYGACGVKLITISADEPETEAGALPFLKKAGITGPAYIKRAKDDDAFINAIDPKWSGALPALFIYDRQGRKTKAFIGETEMAEVDALLAKLAK
jgi:thiol-disulfide isomerase/thioredoxin